MPSLLASFKSKKKEKEKDTEKAALASHSPPESTNAVNNVKAPPPAYAAAPSNGDTSVTSPPPTALGNDGNDVDITAAFSNLSLDSKPKDPEVDTCLAHLKLLFAIQALKEDVGLQDGLWNIWDSRADLDSGFVETDVPASACPPEFKIQDASPEEVQKLHLSKLREKRWAIFVARAVDRYEAWWASLPQVQLRESDMVQGASAMYEQFVNERSEWPWASHMLPPLDVLMVWHAHMLNPRAFLEDTIRCGLSSLWATGMPWHLVSTAIDSNFDYNVSDEAKTNWVASTGCDWSNVTTSPNPKVIKCPACQTSLDVPWTTCGRGENSKDSSTTQGLVGRGYADGDLNWGCTGCQIRVTKKVLSVVKFIKDARLLTANSIPMPGTILDPISGKPKAVPTDLRGTLAPRTFANRMIKKKLIIQISDLIQPGAMTPPDMDTIRDIIQQVTSDPQAIRTIEGHPSSMSRFRLSTEARICIRKMMAHYWENFSPFALDLAGAVMRQSIFTQKMYQIDWLHSPSCRETMSRLIKKYQRFISIMASHPSKTCVPTLDVDLAWHTHQLSPSAYYKYTTQHTTKFTDHDDKIEEDKLAEAFEWTMKTYQDKYAEVYSECTCWYCETIRSANTGTVSRLLGVSNQDKAAENFVTSGRAQLCPPDKSAHISAHNAVRPNPPNTIRSTVDYYSQKRQQNQLEFAYAKACKRAEKKGRKLPPRDTVYDHWGYQYYMYSPFMYPMYFYPGLYLTDPGYMMMSGGGAGWASCAAGSCGGGVAAGACGGAGGCGAAAAGAGGAACGTGGNGCGGGGGGCGGGGGGCGGGGGGC